MSRLTQAGTKTWRDKKLAEQGGKCALCNKRIPKDESVLDHDHATGRCRATLHRGCNALLGKIENNIVRNRLTDTGQLHTLLCNLVQYINTDYSHHPRYHTHRNEAEKRERRNMLARKRRAAKKGAKK